MARTLTWYLERPKLGGVSAGPTYRLDRDYDPQYVWAVAKTAPYAVPVIIDLLADGTSIFSDATMRLQIPTASSNTREYNLLGLKLREGAVISLNVVQSDGVVGDITVGLELE